MTGPPFETSAAMPRPLHRLRALRRAGVAEHLGAVRNLLWGLTDPFELESAGKLLTADSTLAAWRGSGIMPETSVLLYGNSTLTSVPPLVFAHLLRQGVLPQVTAAGFDAWRHDALTGRWPCSPAVVVLVLDDHVVFDMACADSDVEAIARSCAQLPGELEEWIARAREQLRAQVIVTTVPMSPRRRDVVIDYRGKARLDAAWSLMNAAILRLGEQTGVVALAYEAVSGHSGIVFESHRIRHIAGVTFAMPYLARLADELARIFVAQLGLARKCLVLDLDGTLWDGTIAEDDIDGIRVGGVYPGSGHAELQRAAAALAAQGVLLAVASKNDHDVAMAAFERHPEMLLRPPDLLAHRIDFAPKHANLRAIAAELGIHTDALVFFDDSPVERGLMRAAAPEVTVVEPTGDPADHAAVLLAAGHFNVLARTTEDSARPAMMRADRQRFPERPDNLDDYLRGLDQRLELHCAGPMHRIRVAQLFGKTNQFNLTGQRYTVVEMAEPAAHAASFFVCGRLSDRFGDSGIVIAVALRDHGDEWSIENLVLSCRAFGRGVESALLAVLARAAARTDRAAVTASFVPTGRNSMCADLLGRNGFEQIAPDPRPGATRWRRPADNDASGPAHLTVAGAEEVLDVLVRDARRPDRGIARR
ncbi:HAD-IIIC family phosphatase [Nocardia sp. NBC_00511]|uniref:HAD-IIIC family phosphatase n=1 Tax=Nocardia sp. NBC_00511 TaxID=2903591 RepID=UPI0030DF479A